MLSKKNAHKIELPKSTLYEDQLLQYVKLFKLSTFRCIAMRDELPDRPWASECGILNLNCSSQSGSHWCLWVKVEDERYYFDSFAEIPPRELILYLKTQSEYENNLPVIKCNATVVQKYASHECGSLCLYTVYQMMKNGQTFSQIINQLHDRYQNTIQSPLTLYL